MKSRSERIADALLLISLALLIAGGLWSCAHSRYEAIQYDYEPLERK